MDKKFRYCVLYIRDADQDKLKTRIEAYLPQEHGEVFIPRMQLYRRGEKKIKEITIFSGYVFLYTDLNIREVHEMLKNCRAELNSVFVELALREKYMGNADFLYQESEDDSLYELSDLNEEETEYLDVLRQGNGLLSMSCGYEEEGKFHVMEGPLKVFEEKIQHVDKHNRKAFLRFELNGRQARAGFECKPKTHWFPKENARVATLSDGTEVDLTELSKKAMMIKI